MMTDATVCTHDSIELQKAEGRKTAWHHISNLPIPAELELPTCTNCGTWFSDRKAAEALDAAMAPVYATELADKAKSGLAAITRHGFRQRDLEPLLGLSAGYLSKLRNDKTEPSPMLAAVLMLLGIHPEARIRELRSLWPAGTQVQLDGARISAIGKTIWKNESFTATSPAILPDSAFKIASIERTTKDASGTFPEQPVTAEKVA